ncbi:putative O-methyltransferase domain, plant methyltransferase dimerization [Dioscorea sansibarensis]
MKFTTTELVEAQVQVWNLLFSYLKSMCLKCSLELDIADALKKQGKPMELSELASTLSIPSSKFKPFGCFMTTLVHLSYSPNSKMILEAQSICSHQHPISCKMFSEGMASDSRLVHDEVMMNCRNVFMGLKSVVDEGGGTGTMVRAIVDAFPGIKCTVFDLPHVIDASEDQLADMEYVGGDMFVSVPSANAILLKVFIYLPMHLFGFNSKQTICLNG